MITIDEVLAIYKSSDLNAFLKKYCRYTLAEKNLSFDKIKDQWKFIGNNSSNASAVGILTNGEKGLIERITNGIDAVIEKQKNVNNITTAKDSDVIIKKAFPKYYKCKDDIRAGTSDKIYAFDADNQVMLVVNDSGSSRKPTFDIIDKGTGIEGKDFENTILSIQHGNKLSAEKTYLIGAFGQGGSTSLAFTEATIIISKIHNHFYFTVIKSVELNDFKNHCYVYLVIEDNISELTYDGTMHNEYYDEFLQSESGTLVRMIETDISKSLRDNEITKPGMLGDYVNSELFNVGLPVKMIDRRADYTINAHNQGRNSFGTYNKLHTWNYVRKEYSGSMKVEVRGNTYNVDYYTILPSKEDDWGKDFEAKKTFEQFNPSLDPIMYIVNGQTITTEKFTKLKNSGLTFMKYRLLIVVNLDNLGMEKYKFFTTDRNHIKETDQTKGFLDTIVKSISNVDKIKEINSIVAEKAINSNIDSELINEISGEIKSAYNGFLKGGALLNVGGHRHPAGPTDETDYKDEITEIEITNSKNEFFSDQAINIFLSTGAQKHINKNAMIYAYLDGKANYNSTPSFMNGRIQFSWDAGYIKPGVHKIQFVFFKNNHSSNSINSNEFSFEILQDKAPENKAKVKDKVIDLSINLLGEQELICDIAKNKDNGTIIANLCLDHDDMKKEVYGFNSSTEKIKETQAMIMKPIILFALFLNESYDNIKEANEKNALIVSFVRSLLLTKNKE